MVTAGAWKPWWESPSDSDRAAVWTQLGRRPQGMVAVAARCRFGRPTVVVTAPVVDGPGGRPEPFPTTFWLTCPYLVDAVSRLESTGWIARISQEIKADGAAREALRAAHEGAARLRSSLLSGEMARRLESLSPAAVERLTQVGVAGSRQWEAVKCLHAHLADHLGRSDNPVGRRVAALLAERGVSLSGSPACASEDGRPSGHSRCLQGDAPAPYNRGDLSDARA
mgnify:CR=1 FL=1